MEIKNIKKGHSLEEYKKRYEFYYYFFKNKGKPINKDELDDLLKNYDNKKCKVHVDKRYSDLIKGKHEYWLIGNELYPIPTKSERRRAYIKGVYRLDFRKPSVLCGIIIGGFIIACIPVGVVHYLTNFSVKLESNNTLKMSNDHAKKDKDFVSNFEFVNEKTLNTFPQYFDSITINGKELSRNDYTFVQDSLNTAKLTIPGKLINGNIVIKGSAVYNGFSKDSWETITSILKEGGTKALKKHYNVNSLVGSTHTVDVGKEGEQKFAEVMVIGENQDHLYSDYYTSASLTLAFTDYKAVIDKAVPFYNQGSSVKSYGGSYLQTVSNEIINKIKDQNLVNSINEVAKYTTYYDETWGVNYDKSKDKIFPLSLKEMGGFDCFTTIGDTMIKQSPNQGWYDWENPCYKYFNDNKSYIYGHPFDTDKKTLEVPKEGLWTRTPSLEFDNGSKDNNAFYLKSYQSHGIEMREFDRSDLLNDSHYFVPAFTIGAETSFEHDSWDNVIAYANQGLDKLKEVYGVDTFIGKEKNLIINGDVYAVRVIGENHDPIAGSTDKLAALTFEFTTDVGLTSFLYNPKVDKSDWSTSEARTKLNSTFINSLPDVIKENLKTVTKYSSKYDVHEEHYVPGVVSTFDKLFVLSYKELGALDYNVEKTTRNPEKMLLNKDPYAVEGDTYQYYIDQIKSYDFIAKDYFYEYYGTSIRNKGNVGYLLRSAAPETINKQLHVDKDTLLVDEENRDVYESLIPCFCIGESDKINESVFEFASWDNVIKNANEGIDKLKEVYKVDSFIGKERTITLNTEKGQEEYNVRVIGENADTLFADQGKTATLTFEFTRCIDPSVRYDENRNNIWSSSTLRYLCNNKYLNQLPQEVQNGIKSVKKTTDSANGVETTEEKLFPLSMYEIGETYKPNQPFYEFYNYCGKELEEGDKPTGQALEHLIAERIKADSRYKSYHLRTPYISDVTYLINCITDGYVSNNCDVDEEIGLAPAFAI